MSFRIIRTIYLKELVDTLRDKRTLIAMIGIPIVLYPALFIIMSQVAIIQQSKMEDSISKIAVIPENSIVTSDWLAEDARLEIVVKENAEDALDAGDIDAILRIPEALDERLAADATASFTVDYDATEGASREAAGRIEDILADRGELLLKDRIAARDLPEGFASPLTLERNNVAPPQKTTGALIGTMLPLLIVVMLGVGAFYPAVDLTAGEKERGTFETLLSTPASKLEIVSGKFLTVFTLSIATGFLNVASMSATLAFQFSQLSGQLGGAELNTADFIQIAPEAAGAIVLVLIPLAFFISAVMMTVALTARSFKDAQNVVTPFFMAIILPALIGVIPDVELNRSTQFIPIGNVALLFRDLLKGTASLDMVFVVFLCTAIYALLALVIASWMFQREEVILSEEKGIPLSLHRGSFRPSEVPTLGMAFGLFAIVMLLIFYVGTYAQTRNIHIGLAITQYLLILVPVVGLLWFARVNLRSALNLRMPRMTAIIATLLTAAGWIVISMQLSVWQSRILPLPEGFEIIEQMLFGLEQPVHIGLLLLVIAVSPAICEEVLFRGALVSGFRKRMPGWAVILLVGILFGIFHLSIHRFVPTALSGIVLTWLVVRSGSIVPAMIFHFLLNGTLVLLGSGNVPQPVIDFMMELEQSGTGLPLWLIAAAILTFAAGVITLESTSRQS